MILGTEMCVRKTCECKPNPWQNNTNRFQLKKKARNFSFPKDLPRFFVTNADKCLHKPQKRAFFWLKKHVFPVIVQAAPVAISVNRCFYQKNLFFQLKNRDFLFFLPKKTIFLILLGSKNWLSCFSCLKKLFFSFSLSGKTGSLVFFVWKNSFFRFLYASRLQRRL
jgi:hypothetical protein